MENVLAWFRYPDAVTAASAHKKLIKVQYTWLVFEKGE